MKRGYNVFRRFCAFVLGAVFLISGILKFMDPVGSEFIMKSYFNFLHIGFMDFSAKFFGVAFALTEAVLGAALMSGVWRKVVGIAVVALTTFFTLLTLVLLIFNPVMDCGCFGEAIHLTHLQTFVKNVILCALCCGAFIPMRELDRPVKVKYVSFALTACSLVALLIYSLVALPLKDYTAFHPGAMLQAAADEQYKDFSEPEFIYEKDGVTQAFSLDALPDSSWNFVDSRIRQDDFAAGTVLTLTDDAGEYCDSLATKGNVLVVSAYRKLSAGRIEGIESLVADARAVGLTPIVLVPSDDVLAAASEKHAALEDGLVYYSDYKTLATLNRSNGGATWISDGQIVRKWSYTLRPSSEKLSAALAEDPTALALETQSKGSLALQSFLLYIFAVLLLL
ncbi:MAG: hypothetical protein SOU95_07485 [Candidatus Cryptobacteroides sp.]|nr:hypothetical protein [Bacteroidales bacterium]MDY2774336.1 hypothetical protein [Candidatus Cryptobacteroides sp.]